MISLRGKIRIGSITSQKGAALLIAMLILLILTVIGVYAVTTSTLDTKITGFHKWHVQSFYAADAGIDYTVSTNPYAGLLAGTWSVTNPISQPIFNVTTTYLCQTPPPIGSGTGIRVGLKAYHYRTVSQGSDPAGIAISTVRMWGYRIGF
jgi:hypothetical protein